MKSKFQVAKHWLQKSNRMLWLEYSILALFILLPMLMPGYILTLDLVFSPHVQFPAELTNAWPLEFLLWLAYFILPGDVIEKLVLFVILLLSGMGMHLLIKSIKVPSLDARYLSVGAYAASIFYMANPFTYSRFMAGQWMVLLGYALLPFFMRAFLMLLAKPSRKTAVQLALWALSVVAVSLHHSGIAVVLAAIIVTGWLWRERGKQAFKKALKWLCISAGLVVIGSLYWVVPLLFGASLIGSSVASFTAAHFEAFRTSGGGALGPIGEVVRLQGFWAEGQDLFTLPQKIVPLWGLIVLLLWIIIGYGAWKLRKANRFIAGVGISGVVAGIVLAATPLVETLQHVPFVAGYREPHKFTNLVALGYSILFAFGVAALLQATVRRFGQKVVSGVAALCLVLPIIITPTMLWGFSGQLSPRQYPTGWYAANQFLKQHPHSKTLFLPWHMYANYSFSGRLIANPAESFFEVPIIASDDPEFRNVPPTTPNTIKQEVKISLQSDTALNTVLRRHNITYIIVAKEQDYKGYDYLKNSPQFKQVSENQSLILYEVKL